LQVKREAWLFVWVSFTATVSPKGLIQPADGLAAIASGGRE
jgi:hypothetical protein